MSRIDRSDLYGNVEIEAFDEKGRPASLMVLADDGNTLIDIGGTALELVNKTGTSVDRAEVKTVDREGKELEPIQSSFSKINNLNSSSVEDYLSLIVKSVYWLQPAEESDIKPLVERVTKGEIFSFPFNYRDGIGSDQGFLVGNKEDAFLIVGTQATLEFVKFGQPVQLDAPDEQEVSADDLDFDLI